MIDIHKATIEDEAKAVDLLKQFLSRESIDRQDVAALFREMVKNDKMGTVLIAEEDGDALGVITQSYPVAFRGPGIYSCIEEFMVSERARGQGVGGKLLEAAIAEATAKGCCELQVNNPSELGYPVYTEHGLKDSGKALKMKLPRQ